MYMKQWIICFTWYMKSPCLSTVLKKISEWRSKNLDKKYSRNSKLLREKKIKTIALITIFFNLAHGKLESHKHIKVIAFRSVIEVFWIDFSNIMHNSGECVLLLFLECLFWWQSFCFCSFVFRGSKNLGFWVKSVGNPWLWYFEWNLKNENFGRIWIVFEKKFLKLILSF